MEPSRREVHPLVSLDYRVRVPANSMSDANNICTNVKAAGGDCYTM